ncbi:MAG: PSD1 domain-containing protein [Planctomycetes bacterium]|nr:PSD1 domain-containing protein [Planctomycetota bacterium]
MCKQTSRWCLVLLFVFPASSFAQNAAGIDLFETKIRPVLVAHCHECHAGKKSRGGLTLDSREALLQGGDKGPAIVPGKADDSLLIRTIRHQIPDLKMPKQKPKLDDVVIADFVKWVNLGAPFPARRAIKDDPKSVDWWSLKPIVKTPIPKIDAPTPIDAFLLLKLREKGLTPSQEADARTLIRRVTYDLHGLPPSPEEIDAFLKDAAGAKRGAAYEALVDRLLASPRYGERWARHWLDVVHYGESNGFGMDRPRFNAWPYRDYVIKAFNDDKPYARFVQEQLAADVLFPDEPHAIPALGFAAAGPFNQSALVEQVDGTDCRKIALNLDRDDMVSSVGATFLSMTVHCARCHQHKFDPISQRDYYRMQAVFAGVGRADRPYELEPNVAARRKDLQQKQAILAKNPDAQPFSPDELKAIAAAQAMWEKSVGGPASHWNVLTKLDANVAKGTTVTLLDDGSLLLGGMKPERDTYTFTTKLNLKDGITAVRLEVLPHDSLPMKGPGRQDNGNLHLSEFRVHAASVKEPSKSANIPIAKATADFNQDGWDIAKAIDGNKATAWGIFPQVGKPHQAIFEFKQPLKYDGDALFTFSLEQLHGGGHLIGRLRLSVTTKPAPALSKPLPPDLATLLVVPADKRTREQTESLAQHYRRIYVDEQLAALSAPAKVLAIASDFPAVRNYRAPKEPAAIFVLKRGDIKQPLDAVSPGALDCVTALKGDFDVPILPSPPGRGVGGEGPRRAALARWITDPANPLTWRSIVNRVWHHHFGQGIVDTPNDLGRMGASPSHPELLDYLAAEFRDGGGSLKKLHRMIVISAAYRQVSAHDDANAKRDADNRYLWRMNRGRLDAEMLRDTLLSVSGKLDLKMAGPSAMQFDFKDPNKDVSPQISYDKFDPDNPASYRRGIYRFIFRNINDPLLETFDAVDPSLSMAKRNLTITPLQALVLYNNRFVLRQCEHLAARLEREAKDTPSRIDRACRLTMGRPPTQEESELLTAYADRHGLANACRVLVNCNDFLFVH